MKKSIHSRFVAMAFGLFALCTLLFSFGAKAGGDAFQVYLNNKLVATQYMTQPLNIKTLELGRANASDQLVIYFTQCNAVNKVAKNRVLTVKDENGKVIKEWKFEDVTSTKGAMAIPVSDLLKLQAASGQNGLSLYYSADGYPKGQILAALKIDGKNA